LKKVFTKINKEKDKKLFIFRFFSKENKLFVKFVIFVSQEFCRDFLMKIYPNYGRK